MSNALLAIRHQLTTAPSFVAIFGKPPDGELVARQKYLKRRYRELVRLTHPDQVAPVDRALAHEVFPLLVEKYEAASTALLNGHYEEVRPQSQMTSKTASTTVTMRSATTEYEVTTEIWKSGDFSNLHLAKTSTGEAVLIKVAAEEGMNAFLAKEASFYRALGQKGNLLALRQYLPELLDAFMVTEGRAHYRVNVFRHRPGFVSLTDIHAAYPRGLDPRDAAWIWRRLLAQALAAEAIEMVHGAIVPDHVLVHPDTHEPLHIGWVHGVERPQERQARITTVIDRWRDWYPDEIFAREIPTLQTDLYMVGKTMIYLAGGEVAENKFPRHYPTVMKDTVAELIKRDPRDRPRDGHALLREFTTGVRQLWGTTFRPLRLPK